MNSYLAHKHNEGIYRAVSYSDIVIIWCNVCGAIRVDEKETTGKWTIPFYIRANPALVRDL